MSKGKIMTPVNSQENAINADHNYFKMSCLKYKKGFPFLLPHPCLLYILFNFQLHQLLQNVLSALQVVFLAQCAVQMERHILTSAS